MPRCTRPLRAYREGGSVKILRKGTDPPFRISALTTFQLRCGQCIGCRVAHNEAWAVRLVHEAQTSTRSSFVTVTYDRQHLPRDRSLHLEHWQKFVRSIRKRIGPLRYYMCGEYGDEHLRPHWHACIFGQDFSFDWKHWRTRNGVTLYYSPKLEEIWGRGFVSIGEMNYSTARYVARYSLKKRDRETDRLMYSRIDRDTGEIYEVRPEFSTMSRKPGLGQAWFNKFKGDVFPSDEVVLDGRRKRPPRYYDAQLAEDELDQVKAKRRERVAKEANLEALEINLRAQFADYRREF